MKYLNKEIVMQKLIYVISILSFTLVSCQREYMDFVDDAPTSTIEFVSITSSCDSACMYDTIILYANAHGDNLKYEWQRAKGSLVPVKDDPSKAYFWGCHTCVGRLTVNCTVSNEFGAYTKEIDVFIWPWTKEKGRWNGWEKYVDRFGQW